jgi:hypothetical protein
MEKSININQKQADFLMKAAMWDAWKNDPVKWAEDCVKVPSVGGSKLVKLYEPQKAIINSFYNKHLVIMNKSRQVGGSFLMKIVAAHVVLFFENVTIGILSKSGPEASKFAKDVKNILLDIPYEWARPKKFIDDNVRFFSLPNKSTVVTDSVSLQNPDKPLRGRSITVLIIDECAFIPKIDVAYAALGPTLALTKLEAAANNIPYGIVLISTPNKTSGRGAWYHGMWMRALERYNTEEGSWVPHQIHWREIPAYRDDPNWYRDMCDILGNDPKRIAQELELEFIGSEGAVFDANVQRQLNKLITDNQHNTKNRSIMKMEGGVLIIFGEVNFRKFHLIGVDTASASGLDYSAVQVVEFTTGRQVMEYRGKLEPKLFAEVVKKIEKFVPKNLIIVENTGGYGLTVLNELQFDSEKEYNIYGEYKNTKLSKTKNTGKEFIPGLSTNTKTRPLITEALYNVVSNDCDSILSERLAIELLALAHNKNGKIQAEPGFNDDLAMAYAFICYVKQYGMDKYAGFLQGEVEARENEEIDDAGSTKEAIHKWIVETNSELVTPEEKVYKEYMNQYKDKLIKQRKLDKQNVSQDDLLEEEMIDSGIFD